MIKAKSQFACDPRVIRALRARQNYKLAPRELTVIKTFTVHLKLFFFPYSRLFSSSSRSLELPITRTFFDFPWKIELSGVDCNLFAHELSSSWHSLKGVRALQIELEFGGVGYWVPGEKSLLVRERTNNKLNPHQPHRRRRRRRDLNPGHNVSWQCISKLR